VLGQDTGGAISGPVRADLYWGTGPQAAASAGEMRQPGRMWLIWPRGVPLPGS
jgi:membrane-bound lytic murein transglycosylase A